MVLAEKEMAEYTIRTQPTDRLPGYLAAAAVLAHLAISSDLLIFLGIPYSIPGGNPFVKFHPATYLTILAFCALCAGRNSPLLSLKQFAKFLDFAALSFIVFFIAILNIIRFGFATTAFFIDTLVGPALLGIVIISIENDIKLRIFYMMLWFLIINAGIAVMEVALQRHFIPYFVEGRVLENYRYFRATALLGHPLMNAHVTALAAPFAVLLSPNRGLRALALFVFAAGLLAFNARLGFAIAVLVIAVIATVTAVRNLARGRFTDRQGAVLILSMFVVPMFIIGLMFVANLGDRIVEKFLWDESAQTRVESVSLLSRLSVTQLLYGASNTNILLIRERLIGGDPVQSSWVLLILRVGLIAFIPLIVAFFLVLLRLWRTVGIEGKSAVIMFLVFVSGGPTLAVKSGFFGIFVALLLCSTAAAERRGSAWALKRKGTFREAIQTHR